ncbi:MAG TPA: hypothetical protein VNQ90_02250, partial [Chthoniobacteraceae bacterium]|nr:hypothetical protein [Chthoniobacteraceae bacterium]
MNNKLHLITASIIALGSSCSLMAQTDTIYRYSYLNGSNNGTFNYTNGFTISPGVNAPNEMNGANWSTLINSGRVWGTGHSTAVRAFDWAEDNQVNYLTTGATDGAATWYFSTNANTNAQSGTPGGTTFVNGFFDGESILGNANIIAIYDDQVVLFNPDAASGSTALSLYSVNTRVVTLSNFGFNTFTGGSLNGLTLESQMDRLIGAEDGYLWYLEGDGSAIAYGITSGLMVLDPTWTTFSGGLMDGISLSNALDSGHYLGIGAGPDFYFVASVIP